MQSVDVLWNFLDAIGGEIRPDVGRAEAMGVTIFHEHARAGDGVFDILAAVIEAGQEMRMNVD